MWKFTLAAIAAVVACDTAQAITTAGASVGYGSYTAYATGPGTTADAFAATPADYTSPQASAHAVADLNSGTISLGALSTIVHTPAGSNWTVADASGTLSDNVHIRIAGVDDNTVTTFGFLITANNETPANNPVGFSRNTSGEIAISQKLAAYNGRAYFGWQSQSNDALSVWYPSDYQAYSDLQYSDIQESASNTTFNLLFTFPVVGSLADINVIFNASLSADIGFPGTMVSSIELLTPDDLGRPQANSRSVAMRQAYTSPTITITSDSGVFPYATLSSVLLASQAPEPASWAMMIAGFSVIGIATRRRKVAVSFRSEQ